MAIAGELPNTAISRLIIRAPSHVQERVRRELQLADWPNGGPEQIVFVRKLSATATSSNIGKHLLEKARRQVDHGGDGENVVRFANRLDMLAALLADITSGSAAGRWYWRRWSHLFAKTISKAIYSVLADNLTSINALMEVLARRRQLTTVWQNLAEEEAEQLFREVCWQNGYSFSENDPTQPTANVETSEILPTLPQRLIHRWHDVLAAEPTTHRFKLGILLVAQEWAPLALLQDPESTISAITAIFKKLQKTEEPSPLASTTGYADIATAMKSTLSSNMVPEEKVSPSADELTGTEKAPLADAELSASTKEAGRRDDLHREKTAIAEDTKHTEETTGKTDEKPAPRLEKKITEKAEIPDTAHHPFQQVKLAQSAAGRSAETSFPPQFATEQGGVLYLLNFLNRPDLQRIISDHWQQLANGWIWLFRVAELLDFNVQDPMANFLAGQIGLDNRSELATLPSLPERERIESLAEEWYGRNDIWNPSLLQLAARIHHNSSHVDMYCDLADVRLELRLAGLDINPGWLPWLGRVVQFHFDHHGGRRHE